MKCNERNEGGLKCNEMNEGKVKYNEESVRYNEKMKET